MQPGNRGELVAFPLAGRLVVEISLTGHWRVCRKISKEVSCSNYIGSAEEKKTA